MNNPIVTQFLKMARLSGVAPQVAVVMGACAGEPALETALNRREAAPSATLRHGVMP
jgi:acetyl-CoA carboxylase carboxyltransferase component